MFCEGVSRWIAKEHQDIATVERAIAQRGGRVYIDFMQNRRGQTIVAPYGVRPVPGGCVSAPLRWSELDLDLELTDFTMTTMPARIEREGDLFAAALTDRQDLAEAIDQLHGLGLTPEA